MAYFLITIHISIVILFICEALFPSALILSATPGAVRRHPSIHGGKGKRKKSQSVFFLVFGCVSDIREKSWSSLGTMASRFSYQRPENAISKAEEFIQVGE